jgi:pyrroloquinoline quinone (PQQ) biosynthesis protein C
MYSVNELLQACRQRVQSARALKHKFFDLIHDGQDEEHARALLREWSRRDYWVSREFPALVATLAGEVEDLGVRLTLVRNLWDECGKGNLRNAHFSLYNKFLASIGESEPAQPDSTASAFLQAQKSYAYTDRAVATGVFCYANEYMCQFEFASLTGAVVRLFPNSDTRYFTQLNVDVRHAAELEEAMVALVPDDLDRFAADLLEALDHVLEVRGQFYDAVVAAVVA